jgi:hypothetical protein
LIQSIITQYIHSKQLDKNVKVRLEFEGEQLDPTQCIGDTEVEDGDMLTAVISTIS